MPRLKAPSMKMKRWARSYLEHGNALKAAQEAYPDTTDYTQRNIAFINKKHPLIQSYIARILDKEGLSDEKIASKLNKIIDAGTVKRALNEAKPKDALNALNMAVKLKDLLPATKIQTESKTLNLNLEGKSTEELNQTLDQLMTEIKQFKTMQQEVIPLK